MYNIFKINMSLKINFSFLDIHDLRGESELHKHIFTYGNYEEKKEKNTNTYTLQSYQKDFKMANSFRFYFDIICCLRKRSFIGERGFSKDKGK